METAPMAQVHAVEAEAAALGEANYANPFCACSPKPLSTAIKS